MKTLINIIFVLLIMGTSETTFACLPGGITFYSQQQIDDFATNYPGCTGIDGTIEINETTNGNITNLNGLSQLTYAGDLIIFGNDALTNLSGLENLTDIYSLKIGYNDALTSLSGLDNLGLIEGFLEIKKNDVLTDLSGLSSVTIITEHVEIRYNSSLTSLTGLENVTKLYDYLWIFDNELLENLTGLNNITSITGLVDISHNNSLFDFTGLNSLVSIGGKVNISYCPMLNDFSGIDNLETIGNGLFITACVNIVSLGGFNNLASIAGSGLGISGNTNLDNLSDLSSLSSIGGSFSIVNNTSLTSLLGLENLTSINGILNISYNDLLESLMGIQNIDPTTIKSSNPGETPDLSIYNNLNLSECDVQSICDFLDLPDKIKEIHHNMTGCNSEIEVEDACNTPGSTFLLSPANGDEDVNVESTLNWEEIDNADGYYMSIGTESGETDILENEDLGNVTSYQPDDLPCGNDIYITITPYNDSGNADDAIEESFSTESVSADAGDNISYCYGESVVLTASGGTTYKWYPEEGLSDPNIANPTANPEFTTTYTVTVSNDGRCEETDEIKITVNALKVDLKGIDISILGANNGKASCNILTGKEPFTYAWSNSQNTQAINNLSSGSYFVTVNDANSCVFEDSVFVEEFVCPTLTIIDTVQNVTCYNSCDGNISILGVTNGTSPFVYNWEGSQSTTSEINSLCKESYTVTVTDSKNCTMVKNFQIQQPEQILVNINFTNESGFNKNDGTADCNPSGGSSDSFTYMWSNGATTKSVTGLAPGTYTVTITDKVGCSEYESIEVSKYKLSSFKVNSYTQNVRCFGDNDGSIEILSVEGATEPVSYLWNTGGSSLKLENLYAGDYSVTIVDANNLVTIDSFIVYQVEDIEFSEIKVNNITDNNMGSISIETNKGAACDYLWSGPNNFISEEKNIINLEYEGCYTLVVKTKFFECTKDTTICIENNKTSGLENFTIHKINMYPNPTDGSINLDFSTILNSEIKISFFDFTGKKQFNIIKNQQNKTINIDISSLSSGLFIVKIEMENNTIYKKLFVEK